MNSVLIEERVKKALEAYEARRQATHQNKGTSSCWQVTERVPCNWPNNPVDDKSVK